MNGTTLAPGLHHPHAALTLIFPAPMVLAIVLTVLAVAFVVYAMARPPRFIHHGTPADDPATVTADVVEV